MESKKDKLYIIGNPPGIAGSHIGKLIAESERVEFITAEQAKEMNIQPRPESTIVPIIVPPNIAPPNFDLYFQPPPTRRERRQEKRKKH